MNGTVLPMKLVTKTEKKTRTTVDTIMVTPESIQKWKLPTFQRPLRLNEKVKALATQIYADGGIIPGIITLGILDGEKFLLDGQHRKEAYLMSGCAEGYVDVRVHHFETMAEMGQEFVNLNSQLVRMRPDDILRGLEGSVPALSRIRKECPFVGYDMIRRGEKSPIVSMSMVLRMWRGSQTEVPAPHGVAASASSLAQTLTEEEARGLIDFLHTAYDGFGRDAEYARLWGGLNMILCAWLYRRLVITQYSPISPRLNRDQFKRCLMSVSAESTYLDWLTGRHLGERDRAPAYSRLKAIFAGRLHADTGKKAKLPSPAWSTHSSGSR